MSRKAILTYRKVSDNTQRRLLLVDGIVVNPAVEDEIRAGMDDFEAIQLRRSGEKVRSLVFVPPTE